MMSVCRILVVLGVALLAALPSATVAEEAEGRGITFRRVYVPADRLSEGPFGNQIYKPIDAAVFERWATGIKAGAKPPRIGDALFTAALGDQNQLTGELAMKIESPAGELAAMPLEPCNLALGDLQWEQEGEKIPARIGSDQSGRLVLFIRGSGTLHANWSLRGKRNRGGQLQFNFEVPASGTKQLLLELPPGTEPDVRGALIDVPPVTADSMRRWELQLSGGSRIPLQISRSVSDSGEKRLDLLTQSRSYDFRIDRMQLDQELSLSVYRKPIRRLSLAIDPELRLVEAFVGEEPIEWLEQSSADSEQQKVVLLFPEPVAGNDRIVRIRAIASPVFDAMWRLPRVIPEDLSWQEGTTTLLVSAPLVTERLELFGCQQLRAGRVPGREGAEVFELQDHGPDAGAEVVLALSSGEGTVDRVTTYTVREGAIEGRMVCDLSVRGPPQFQIRARVPDAWNIESVVADDSGVLAGWRQERVADGNVCILSLRRGISSAAPLRFEITGRRSRTGALELIDLQMLQFEGFRRGRELIEFSASDPYRVRVDDRNAVPRLTLDQLGSGDRERVEENFSFKKRDAEEEGRLPEDLVAEDSGEAVSSEAGSRIWYDTSDAQSFSVRLEKPVPRFSVETRIEAQVSNRNLNEQCVLECTPQQSSIDSMQVVFSQKRDAPIRCSVIDHQGVVLDGVRAVKSEVKEGTAGDTRERWTLRWNRPLSAKFQILIDRTTRLDQQIDIALVSLPEAAEQRATASVLGSQGNHVAVANQKLKALPVEEGSNYARNPMQARFRYDPERDVDSVRGGRLSVVRRSATVGSALIWRAIAESWFTPEGQGTHRMTYYLENEGQAFFTASLGQGEQFESAEVDGVQIRMPPVGTDVPLAIALPEDQRFSVVELQWSTPAVTGYVPWIRKVPLPLPEIDVPVIEWTRVVHAPPGYVTTDGLRGVGADRVGLSWQQRLFGPLARLESAPVFDPFDSESWSAIPLVTQDAKRRVTRRAEKFVTRMGIVLSQNPQTASWGDLARLGESVLGVDDTTGERLWVDVDALSAVGIGPETPIEVHQARTPARLAAETLQAANLVLAATRQGWILSTAAALQSSESDWLIEGVVCRVPGTRTGDTNSALPSSALPFKRWREEKSVSDFPWQPVWREGFDFAERQGGSTLYLDRSQTNLASVQLVDVRSLRGLQWTLFTVVALAGCLWGPFDLRKGCLGLLCLAAAALMLPATVAPLATASFCGAGVAFLFHRFAPLAIFSAAAPGQRPHTAPEDAVTKTMRLSGSEISLLSLAGILFFSQMASHAADPSKGSAVVVIPVDSESKKGGDTYYLSPALFEGVYEERLSSPSVIDWLLTGAHYRIEFDWEDNQKRLEVEQCTASIQVEVGLRETRVLIPIASEDVELDQCRVTIDGKVYDGIERTPEGAFLISIDEPGIYLVEFSFPLRVVDTGGLRQVRVPIPALATSTLEVDLPVDAVPPEVLSAQGATRRDEVRNRLQVDLGNTDQLVLQWREGATAAEGDAADVDQLIWMKVQPGAVVVDARLKIDSRDRRSQRIQIATDPQLRLLSPLRGEVDGQSVPINHVRTEPGDPQTIELQWDKAVDGELEIRLPFLWAGVSGMGTVRIPQFDVVGTRDYRRWIAVSVDPSLIVDRDAVSGDSLLKPLSIATAGETWNVAGQAPDFFYQQTGSQTDWSLPTRLEDSETVAFAKVALGISDKVTEVVAEYDLETTDGHRCQYHIDLPDHFQPERVEVFSEGVDRVLRWSTHEESGVNQLTLFLAEAVRGIQQLVIHGHMPHSAESLRVPRFTMKDVTMRGGQIAIYRGPRVQVRLEGEKVNWQRLDDPVPMARIPKNFGRAVGVYEFPVDTSAPRIAIAPNPIDAEAIQVVSLNRIDSKWIVDVDLRIEVKRGRLDTIRLRIPDDYAGPFRLDPPLPFTIKPLPGGAGSLLEVHPKDAITDALRFSLRGPLDIAPEDPVRCPIISTQDIPRVSRFVVIPKKVDLQDASWKTAGLVPRRLPEDSENAPLAGTSVTSFQVTGRDYRAVLESVGQPAQEPEIPLATVDVATGRVDRYFGRVIFHLVPAGLSRVRLCLPHDSAKLLRIRVDDRSTTMAERDGCWEIELHSSNLLQRIEVLYSAPYSKRGRGMRGVSQPSLAVDGEKIPVDSTLWSLAGADRSGRWHAKGSPIDTESAVARQYEHLHKRMRTSLDVLSDVTSAEPVEALLPWYNRTVRHLVSTEAEMDSLVAKLPASVPTAVSAEFAARSEVLAEQVRDLAGRLVTQGVFPKVEAFRDVGPLGPDPWQGIFPRPQALAAEEPQGTLALEPPAGLSSTRSLRWWLAAMVLLAAGVIGFSPEWVDRWMHCSVPLLPLLFAIAMFYWLFLSPSILGFLVMTLIGVTALACGWNRAVVEVPPRSHQGSE